MGDSSVGRFGIGLKVAIIIAVVALPLLVAAVVYSQHRSRETQPIGYSHKVHIGAAGMTCTDCHVNVEKMARATIPNVEVCQTCHNDQPLSKSPEESKVLQYVKDNTTIPWQQIYDVPDHVYFSHSRHVVDGALECSACHGNMAEQTEPVSYQIVPISMDNCLKCHKQRKVSTDCLSCHR